MQDDFSPKIFKDCPAAGDVEFDDTPVGNGEPEAGNKVNACGGNIDVSSGKSEDDRIELSLALESVYTNFHQ